MAAALVIIALGVFAGMSVANLDPTRAQPVAQATSEPTPRPTPRPRPSPSVAPSPEVAPSPSPSPSPDLIGTISFGRGLDGAQGILDPTTEFGPNSAFAHSISVDEPFGVPSIQEGVWRVEADGTETQLQDAADTALGVSPDSTVAGFSIPSAGPLLEQWGPGTYMLRVYRGEELIAEGTFTLVP